MAWTDKMVEDLRVMWKQGLTTGEIGKRLGVSKNSIVGKVHRLQLDARPSPIKKKEEKAAEPVAQKAKCPAKETSSCKAKTKSKAEDTVKNVESDEIIGKTFAPTATCSAKSYDGNAKLTDLDNHTCRWPLGDPKDDNFHFCGKKVRTGQTYCEEHSALAYVKPNVKK